MSYTLLSSFAYMDVAPEGEHGCNFFHISEERGFGLIILIMGLDRGTCKLVEVRFSGWTLDPLGIAVVLLRCGKFE